MSAMGRFDLLLAYLALAARLAQVHAAPPGQQVFGFRQGTEITSKDVRGALKDAEIIPTVIDDFVPSLTLDAEWSSKKEHASLGNTIKPKKLQDAPSVSLHDPSGSSIFCRSSISYVIALTDPDAPSRDDPKWSEMCHWIAVGASLKQASGSEGGCGNLHLNGLDDIMPYKAPGPPAKTGKHRYVFLAFAPENGTTETLHPSKPSDRQHWGYKTGDGETKGVRDWAKENGLVPVAANFIYAKSKKQ